MRDFGIPVPARIAALQVDARGFPIPFFVERPADGSEPDFRIMAPDGMIRAVRKELCWICGQRTGRFRAFVGGPLAAGQRISAEPPSHVECAEFAARACPFLANPGARRRVWGMPETKPLEGKHTDANPGVVAVFVGRGHDVLPSGDGVVFRLHEPAETRWFRQGRPATRDEVIEALPLARSEFLARSGGPGAAAKLSAIEAAIAASLPPR